MNSSVYSEQHLKKLGVVLLRIGSMMQSNGSSTSRIRMTVDRIADAYGYNADLFITQRALTITVSNHYNEPIFSGLRRTNPPGVNFSILSGISTMSWKIHEHKWKLFEINEELDRLESLPRYNRFVLLSMVSAADASFCAIAGGNPFAMAVSFIATFGGLFVRQEAHKFRYNAYLCVFFASLASTLIAGAFRKLFPEMHLEAGFATCVLYLIPGVPLINGVTDLFDGNILNALVRLGSGLVFSFMIALGMFISILIYSF